MPASGKQLSSADFGKVASALAVAMPERLIHNNVTGGRSNDQGFSADRQHAVHIVDLPSHVISMTVGELEPGQLTRLHRHNYETLIYVLAGQGSSIIGDRKVDWRRGDAFYVPVWAWHRHINTSDDASASYLACENAPHLQNLGIALREEA